MKLFNKLSLIALGAIMTVGVSVGASVGHDTVVTYAAGVELAATFTLGADGSATHKDGNSKTTYSETNNGLTLSISSGNKMYPGSIDAKGNGCIKFGTNSATGSCQFIVPNDIVQVVIAVGKYKANASKFSVNGTSYTLTKNSNDGAYDEITVDTTSTKTVKLATVSGGVRAMMNTITWYAAEEVSEEDKVSVTGVTLDQEALNLQVCYSAKLTATVAPDDATKKGVSWSSEDETIATVNDGTVYGVGLGTTTITVTTDDGEFTDTCEVTVTAPTESYTLVTDSSDLNAGDQIVVAAADYSAVMSNVVAGNNVSQTTAVKDGTLIYFGNDAGVLTLTEGASTGTFGLTIGGKYLYAASSDANQLKAQDTLDGNASWKIEIGLDGVASVVSQGTYTRNTLQYNSDFSLFSCYASDKPQSPIAIYRLTDENTNAADAFAASFLTKTGAVCEATQNGAAGEAPQAMKDVWAELEEEYNTLSDTVQDLVQAKSSVVNRYHTIMAKYSGLNDFMGIAMPGLNTVPMFASNNVNTNVLLLVAIASLVAMGLVAVVIRRRKYNA